MHSARANVRRRQLSTAFAVLAAIALVEPPAFGYPIIIPIGKELRSSQLRAWDKVRFRAYLRQGYGIHLWVRESDDVSEQTVARGERFQAIVSGTLFVAGSGRRLRRGPGWIALTPKGLPIGQSLGDPADPPMGFVLQSPEFQNAPKAPAPAPKARLRVASLPDLIKRNPLPAGKQFGQRPVFKGTHMKVFLLQINGEASTPAYKGGEFVLYVYKGNVTLKAEGNSYAATTGSLVIVPKSEGYSISSQGAPAALVVIKVTSRPAGFKPKKRRPQAKKPAVSSGGNR